MKKDSPLVPSNIDFTEFYEILLDATHKTLVFTREHYPNNTFYTFGLTYKMWHSIMPACNTEQHHMIRGKFTEEDRRNQTLKWAYSRWYSSEWMYAGPGRNDFAPVTHWLQTHMSISQQVKLPPESDERAAMKNGFIDSCLKTLKALDNEGLFGQGKDRDAVVVILLCAPPFQTAADQDYIHQLNPLPVYERWWFEWELCRHARSLRTVSL